MPEISKIKLTSGDEYNIKDTTAREMISSHTHTNESMGFGYGTCDTAASTTVKTVSISNYKLSTDGGIVSIKFDYEVLADDTLNINNTGAKPIYYNGSAITANIIKAGDTATFIYDGTNYNLISLDRDFNPITVDSSLSTTSTNPVQNSVITNALNNKADNTHTHTNESMGFGYCHTNYSYFCGIVDDYTLTDGDIIICRFENNVSDDENLTINNTQYPIYYNGSPITYGIINAGDTVILKYNENLDLSFSRFDFIDLYHFYELFANNSNSQEEINIDAPIDEIEIINGQNFNIRFDYDVPANATLNIDGIDDDAKPIYYNGSPITNDIIKANDNVIFIYNINDGRYDLLATNNYNNENVNHFYYESALICYGITLDGYTQTKGGIVSIKFYDYDVEPNATLNINNTGAKPIYYNGHLIRSDIIKAGDIATFIYDGTNYNLISLDRDFNIINESMGFGYGICIDASTTAKTVSMYGYELTTGGIVSIKFYCAVPAKATLDINSTGAKFITYNGGLIRNNIIKSGDTATFIYDGTNYNLISLDRDFNPITVDSSLSTTSTNPVENSVITNALNNKADNTHTHTNESMGFGYGYCTTAASTTAKTVSIYGYYELTKGGIVSIKFYCAVPAKATLNINNKGAKPIYYNGSIITDNIIKAGDTATFIYDGTNYNLISLDRDFINPITVDSSLSTTSTNPVQNRVITNALNNKADNTHTHSLESLGIAYGECYTEPPSSFPRTVSIDNFILKHNSIVTIKFKYSVPAGATLNINNTGDKPIYYNGVAITDNIIKARGTATFIYNGTNYNLISLDRDFNPITVDTALSTTSTNPVENNVITNALNNYMPTIVGTQIESTNNWTGNAQFETLEDGQRILYYLPYDNSSGSDVVLNLTLADGTTQTGNINCYLSGSTRLNSQYEAGNFIPLIYKENIAFNGSSTTYTGWWAYTDKDIDSKVQNTLNNTTKAYITGTTSADTNTGTQIFDTGVYLENTAGNFHVEGTVNGAIPYGDCSTAADTAAKTVTVPGTFSLVNGARVTVRFTVSNSADNPTLNVNNTGAKPILYRGTTIKSYLAADRTYQFIYNSDLTINSITGAYEIIGDLDTNSTYGNASLSNGYAICTTAEATAAKTATLSHYALTTHGRVSVYFQNAVTGEATLNINSKGAKQIVYADSGTGNQNSKTSATGYIKAGSIATFVYDGTYYRCIARDATDNPESVSTDAASVGSAVNQYARADHKHSLADVALNSSISAGTLADNSTFTVVNSITTNRAGQVEGIVSSTYTLSDTKSSILYGEISTTNASITTTNKNIHVIKFNYNVSDNENLTINNTQYPIYYNGNAITSGIINNGDIAMFIQDDINQYYNLIFINKSNT